MPLALTNKLNSRTINYNNDSKIIIFYYNDNYYLKRKIKFLFRRSKLILFNNICFHIKIFSLIKLIIGNNFILWSNKDEGESLQSSLVRKVGNKISWWQNHLSITLIYFCSYFIHKRLKNLKSYSKTL